MHSFDPISPISAISLQRGKRNKPSKYTSHQRIMSSSFGSFPFPGIPGATAAGGVPLGMMAPHSTTVMSTDAGIGTGAGTGTAPLSAPTPTPSQAKKANSNDKKQQQQQQQDRRERAKLHARKCREKKKHELENLQEEEKLLREENLRLRALIRSKMPDQAQNIVSECCYSSERVRHLNPYIFQQAVGDTSSSSPTARAAPSSPPAQLGRNDFDGDVKDSRFVAALDVLSSFYKSSRTDITDRDLYRQLMNGSWRSLSRPAFPSCLGMKNDGSFVYELGTMSFGMFRPANLRCSIQNTLTHVSPATRPSDGSPTIAPWSLRRELAVLNDGEDLPNGNISDQNYSMLKTYE